MDISQSELNVNDLQTEEEIEQEANARFTGLLAIYRAAKVEDRKLLSISFMFFLIVYVYSVSKDLKDAFIIGRQVPASISVLKVFWVPPIATFFSLLVSKLSVRMRNETVLKFFLYGFTGYFLLYGLFVPFFRDSLLEANRMGMYDLLSDGKMAFKDFVAFGASIMTFTSWTGTLHFIASEVWGTIVLSLLFMQMFNEICSEKQFKRFLPIVYCISNSGLLLSAATSFGINTAINRIEYNYRWMFFSAIFVVMGVASATLLFMQNYLFNVVLPVQICRNESKREKKGPRATVGFVEGLKMVFSTQVIVALCTMVLGYNILMIMNESSYKSCQSEVAKERKKDREGSVLRNKCIEEAITSVLVMGFFISPGRNAINWIGWTKYAMITPLCATVASILILGLALVTTGCRGQNLKFISNLFGKNPSAQEFSKTTIAIEQYCGIILTSILKVFKYVAFDISKEYFAKRIDIVYRARFRAVYDGICARFGKAAGSILQLVCNQLFNTLDIRQASFPYLILCGFLLFGWFSAVIYLGKKYNKSVERDDWVELNLKQK